MMKHTIRNDYRLSVSKEKYKNKNKIDWSKVEYQRGEYLKTEDICPMLKEGYCFTSIFNKENFGVSEKTETNWTGSDFVVFDLDNVWNEITLSAFLESLKYVPTIAYTTPNCNKKNKDKKPYSRFRLLYAFTKTITDKATYQSIYDTIQSTFNEELFDPSKKVDNCGRSPVQQFSGNATKNWEVKVNELLYEISDFDKKEPTEKPVKKADIKERIDNDFIQNLNTLKPTDFLAFYRDRFQIIYETQLNYNEDGFALVPNDYVRIQRNFTIYKEDGKIQSKYHRLKDGERRRHTLFCNAKIRCQIKPNISIEELTYNLVYDRHYFFDNTDKVLSNQCLLRIAIDAQKATYEMVLKKKPKFRTDNVFCRENQIKPNALKMMVRRKLNFEDIGQWYDIAKSVKDNLKFAEDNNIKVCRATLYNFCSANGINPKGEPMGEPIKKAEECDMSSVYVQGEPMHQAQQETPTENRKKPISLTEWMVAMKNLNATINVLYAMAV